MAPEGLQHLNQMGTVIGQALQPQSEYNQPFHIPVPMTMASTMHGYYNNMFTTQPIANSGGLLQPNDTILIFNVALSYSMLHYLNCRIHARIAT